MKSSTRLIRFTQMLLLGAIVAGTAASVAAALPVVDVGDSAGTQANYSPQGLQADGLRLQGIAHAYQQSQAVNFSTAQGLRADGLRLQGIAHAYQQSQPALDVLERFAATHPYGIGLSSATESTLLSRPPDVRDVAAGWRSAASANNSTTSSVVSRPPDVTDAAQALRTVSPSQSGRFDWGDYAIGIGSGMGLVLVLAGGLAMGLHRRHSVQTA